jgi:hypothetical protein
LDTSTDQQRRFRFSLRTLFLFVTATAAFFAVVQWTDLLTAFATFVGAIPLAMAIYYRCHADTLAFYLFLTGWILPSILPPYAVAFGVSGPGNSDFYTRYVYLGEVGFFSRGIVLEDNWEETHGHTFPVGAWIPGYLLSFGLLISATLVLCHLPRASKSVPYLDLFIWPVPVVFAFYSFRFDGWSLSAISGTACFLYVVFAYLFRRHIKDQAEATRLRKLAGLTLAFYPLWILVLALTQQVFPFFGWLATFSACLILMFGPDIWFQQNSLGAENLRDRLRLLFGINSIATSDSSR